MSQIEHPENLGTMVPATDKIESQFLASNRNSLLDFPSYKSIASE